MLKMTGSCGFFLVFLGGIFCALFMAGAAPARAETFFNTLFNANCKTGTFHEKSGCKFYLQHRIQFGKSRGDAASKCAGACPKFFSDPEEIAQCRLGCDRTAQKDCR
jgi:hypothetical protein